MKEEEQISMNMRYAAVHLGNIEKSGILSFRLQFIKMEI